MGSADLSQVAPLPPSRGHFCVPPRVSLPAGHRSAFPLIYPLFPACLSSASPALSPSPALLLPLLLAPKSPGLGCSGPGRGRAVGIGIHPLSHGLPGLIPRAGNADKLWLYRASPSPTLGHLSCAQDHFPLTYSSPISQIPEVPPKILFGSCRCHLNSMCWHFPLPPARRGPPAPQTSCQMRANCIPRLLWSLIA